MQSRRARIVVVAAAVLALIALASPDHRADIRILMHETGDKAPQRVHAAVDIGAFAVSVLVTWTRRLGQ